jgi:cell division protein FtsQ
MARKSKEQQIIARQRIKREGLKRLEPFAARARRFLIGVAIMAACVGGAVAAAFLGKMLHHFVVVSDYFRLKKVETFGVSPEVREELIEYTGLSQSEDINLFRLDTEQLRDAVLRDPKLRTAVVSKQYPDTLNIVGEERVPVAILTANRSYAIDEEAMVVGPAEIHADDKTRLPFITGVPDGQIQAGKTLSFAGARSALDLLAALKSQNRLLYDSVSELHLSEHDGLTVYLKGGLEVRFGTESPVEKLAQLEFFLQENPDTKQFEYVDLRFPGMIPFKPKETPKQ